MTTFGLMQDRIADELARTDLTSQIKLAVQTSIDHYERQRFYFNEQRSTASTVASQQNYALPTDFMTADLVLCTANSVRSELRIVTWAELEAATWSTTDIGIPAWVAFNDQQMWLWPIPRAVYTITMSYVRRLADVSATGDTNAWFTSGEEIIRQRAKAVLKIDTLESRLAKEEAAGLASTGCLSLLERSALLGMQGETVLRRPGRVRVRYL